jgi:hypothetical protein
MKTGFTIIIFFLGILIVCQTCTDCSEDNDEYVYIPTYESKYNSECDSLQQLQVVSLSLLNFTLGDTITKNDLKSTPERLIKNLKTTKIKLKTIYNFDSKMSINEKKYSIKCTLITFMDQIAWIDVYFDQNVYKDLINLYEIKYGRCGYNRWQYKNQTIDIDYDFNENATEYERNNSSRYSDSKNKYVRIKYFDHKLVQEVDQLEKHQEMIKLQSDSIRHAKAVVIQREIDRKKKIEEEAKISKETKQI